MALARSCSVVNAALFVRAILVAGSERDNKRHATRYPIPCSVKRYVVEDQPRMVGTSRLDWSLRRNRLYITRAMSTRAVTLVR